jgi:GTP pyrophosphokinase
MLEDLAKTMSESQLAAVAEDLRKTDEDGVKVVDLVIEVTIRKGETKRDYLERVRDSGSKNAKILKCADRISNLTDLHLDTHTNNKISDYLDQTEEFVLPMAKEVSIDLLTELTDLVAKRRELCKLSFAEKVKKLFSRISKNQQNRNRVIRHQEKTGK